MTLFEGIIMVGIGLLLAVQFVEFEERQVETDRAELRAVVMADLHEGIEAYLRHHYADLERCFDGLALEGTWAASSDVGEADDWHVLRLYRDAGPGVLSTVSGEAQTLTVDATDWQCAAVPGAPPEVPSLAQSGYLPAALSGLRYDNTAGAEASNMWRNVDFRALVRLVNLADDGTVRIGLQAVLVAVTPSGEAMTLEEATAMAAAMPIPEVGLLRSVTIAGSQAERDIAGPGGAWGLTLCGDVAGFVTCPTTGLLPHEVLNVASAADSPQRYAFIRGALGVQRPSGVVGTVDPSPRARVVTFAQLARDEALRDVLYRVDIGIPVANRMETDIDMGGYGVVNMAYLSGVDEDGDGLVDRGVGIVGPGAVNPADRTQWPTTVYGDLHVTGALKVGGADFADFADFESGDVYVGRALQVGEASGGGFDTALEQGHLLVQQGVQVGVLAPFDAAGLNQGALWVARAAQVGDSAGGSLLDANLVAPAVVDPLNPAASGMLLVQNAAQVGMSAGGGGFDAGLGAGHLLVEHGAQIGAAAAFDGAALNEGSLWAAAAAQVGNSNSGVAFDPNLAVAVGGVPRRAMLVHEGLQIGVLSPFDANLSGGSLWSARSAQVGLSFGGARVDPALASGHLLVAEGVQSGVSDGFDPNVAGGSVWGTRALQVGNSFAGDEFDTALAAGHTLIQQGLQSGVSDGFDPNVTGGSVWSTRSLQVGDSFAGDQFDTRLAGGHALVAQGLQSGMSNGFDANVTGGSVWSTRALQVGDSFAGDAFDPALAGGHALVAEGLQSGVSDGFDPNVAGGSVWAARSLQVGDSNGGDAFDTALAGGQSLIEQGLQVGVPTAFDANVQGGSLWVADATQVGRGSFDPAVPAGGLLTGDEIRSSGGLRARGPEIVLSGGDGGANRSWSALATGAGALAATERVALRAFGGDMRVHADDAVDAHFVRIDGEDVMVQEVDRADRPLRRALPTFVADGLAYNTAVSPAVTCYSGGARRQFLAPRAWYRNGYAGRKQVTIQMCVNGQCSSTAFDIPLPYTGWSVHGTTGADNGTGGMTGPGTPLYSRVEYCDYAP